MLEDISKKITVEIDIPANGQQQINQYKAALDNLRSSIGSLNKPVADFSKNISSLNKDIALMQAAAEKSAAKVLALSKQLSEQQAKNNAASNQNLKTSLSEADKMKEQALVKALSNTNTYLSETAQAEIDQYSTGKKRLDDFFSQRGLDQQLYQKTSQELLQQHSAKFIEILLDYSKKAEEITAGVHNGINIDTTISQVDITPKKLPFPKIKPGKSFFTSIGDDFKKLFTTVGAITNNNKSKPKKQQLIALKQLTTRLPR